MFEELSAKISLHPDFVIRKLSWVNELPPIDFEHKNTWPRIHWTIRIEKLRFWNTANFFLSARFYCFSFASLNTRSMRGHAAESYRSSIINRDRHSTNTNRKRWHMNAKPLLERWVRNVLWFRLYRKNWRLMLDCSIVIYP